MQTMTQTIDLQATQQGRITPAGPVHKGELPHNEASIAQVHANENSAITQTNDPLNDTNWTT